MVFIFDYFSGIYSAHSYILPGDSLLVCYGISGVSGIFNMISLVGVLFPGQLSADLYFFLCGWARNFAICYFESDDNMGLTKKHIEIYGKVF